MRRCRTTSIKAARSAQPEDSLTLALGVAATLVRRRGDSFVPFFEKVERKVQERKSMVEARRRALRLVVSNEKHVKPYTARGTAS